MRRGSKILTAELVFLLIVIAIILFGIYNISKEEVQFAPGDVYYIDATNGDDSWDGLTPETAWKTWTNPRQQGKFGAGDTIYLMPGIYESNSGFFDGTYGAGNRELILMSNDAKNPITLVAYDNGEEWPVEIVGEFKIYQDWSPNGRSGIIRGIKFFGNNHSTLHIDIDNLIFEDNLVDAGFIVDETMDDDDGDCLKIYPNRQNISIIRNKLMNCDEDCIGTGGARNLLYKENHFYNCRTMQVKGGTENILIENNFFDNVYRGITGGGMGCDYDYCGGDHIPLLPVEERYSAKNLTIRNNVFNNLHDRWVGLDTRGWQDAKIYQNTFYNISTINALFLGKAGFDFLDQIALDYCQLNPSECINCYYDKPPETCQHIEFSSKNIHFYDNIFYSWKEVFIRMDNENSYEGFNFSNNIIYDEDTEPFIRHPYIWPPANQNISILDSSYVSKEILTDPLFINPLDPDGPDNIMWTSDDGFRLRAGSPAIGAGENGEDIGAYEYVPLVQILPNSFEFPFERDWVFLQQDHNTVVDYLITNESSYKGERSLRIDFDGNGPKRNDFTLQHIPIIFQQGATYKLSIFAKSNITGPQIRVRLKEAYRDSRDYVPLLIESNNFTLTTEFDNYTFQFQIPNDEPFIIEIYGKSNQVVSIYLDEVSLTGSIQENYGADYLDLGISQLNKDGIYEKGSNIQLVVNSYFYQLGDYEVSYEIKDFSGEIVGYGILSSKNYQIGAEDAWVIPYLIKDYGIYKIVVYAKKDGILITKDMSIFSSVPESSSDFLGAHLYSISKSSKQNDAGRELSVSWVRNHDMLSYTHWATVQPVEGGSYVWHDSTIDNLTKKGYKILGNLEKLPNWAYVNDNEEFPENYLQEYLNYVNATVSHYTPWIEYWEVWNEPYKYKISNEDYSRLLNITYHAIKEANPNAKVIGMAGAMEKEGVWRYVFSNGSGDYMDIASLHLYEGIKDPKSIRGRIQGYKSLMNDYNKSKPLWDTESGPQNTQSYYDIVEVERRPKFTGEFLTNTNPVIIGVALEGLIDEPRIYNRALSDSEVLRRYYLNENIQYGLVAGWTFDENLGNVTYDISANNNQGDITGANWDSFDCISGSCLRFTKEDKVIIPHSESLNISGPLTLEAWIKPTSVPNGPPSFTKFMTKGGAYSSGYGLIIRDNYEILFQLTGQNGNTFKTVDTADIGIWTHVVGVFDGNKTTVYLNGKNREIFRTYEESVSNLIKYYTIAKSEGIEKTFYYLMGTVNDLNPILELFGLEYSGKPRPVAVAYSVFGWLVGDGIYLGEGSIPNAESYVFSNNGKNVTVVWADPPVQYINVNGVKVYSATGKDLSDTNILNITSSPIYLVDQVQSFENGERQSSRSTGDSSGKTASRINLENTSEVKNGERIKIEVDGELFYLEVKEILEESVSFKVGDSECVLNLGESKKFDLNEDGYYDTLIELKQIIGNKATVDISKIYEKVLDEKVFPAKSKINWILLLVISFAIILIGVIVRIIYWKIDREIKL